MDFGVADDIPYLVMDYAPNGTLRQRHPRGTQLPLPTILSYIKQVAEALQYAHDEKFIHRDIKPENMLLGRRNEVLLSDFGIALIAQSSRYQSTHEMAGTASYIAPEQIQGKPRPASDQYSLGVVVYEWLSGDRPFSGSLTEIATQHLLATPPSLREKVPTIPPAVEEVVMTALAKDPKERFGSVQAFANALEQASRSEQPIILAPQYIPLSSPAHLKPFAEDSPPAPALEPAAISSSSSTTAVTESSQPPAGDAPPSATQPHSHHGQPAEVEPVTTPPGEQDAASESLDWQARARRLLGADIYQVLVSMALGVILYGALNYYLDLLYKNNDPLAVTSVSVLNVSIDGGIILAGVILIIPLFVSTISGPLAGIVTVVLGLSLGSLLAGYDSATGYYGASWTWFVGRMLIGFIAGLAVFLTRGRYNTARSIVIAVALSAIAIVIGTVFTTYGDILVSGISASDAWTIFTRLALPSTIALVVLPILLLAYNAIAGRRNRA